MHHLLQGGNLGANAIGAAAVGRFLHKLLVLGQRLGIKQLFLIGHGGDEVGYGGVSVRQAVNTLRGLDSVVVLAGVQIEIGENDQGIGVARVNRDGFYKQRLRFNVLVLLNKQFRQINVGLGEL